jgi:hypothetical protein
MVELTYYIPSDSSSLACTFFSLLGIFRFGEIMSDLILYLASDIVAVIK